MDDLIDKLDDELIENHNHDIVQNDIKVLNIDDVSQNQPDLCKELDREENDINTEEISLQNKNDDKITVNIEKESLQIIKNEVEIEETSEMVDKVEQLSTDTYSTKSDDCEVITITDNQTDYDIPINEFKNIPLQLTGSWKEFSKGKNNFLKGCKWAPDGSCILTSSDDNILRVFNLPQCFYEDTFEWDNVQEMEAVLKINEGETIYDYCWYPFMNSSDPTSCCFIGSSRNSPVHLWDAFTGELRCSYRSYNNMDELIAARSISFDANGQRLFCGFDRNIHIFDVSLPGRIYEVRSPVGSPLECAAQTGIISCFAFSSANYSYSAAGSYNKKIGIYSEPSGFLEQIIHGLKGGVTHLKFSPDGNFLFSGGRKDPEILCWDMRNLSSSIYSLRRICETNQRIYFDITRCGKYLLSGNNNGVITVWDLTQTPKLIPDCEYPVLEPILFYQAHKDCVNGISLNPVLPFLCSSSGQRKFPMPLSDDEESAMFSSELIDEDNSLRLWWVGKS